MHYIFPDDPTGCISKEADRRLPGLGKHIFLGTIAWMKGAGFELEKGVDCSKDQDNSQVAQVLGD